MQVDLVRHVGRDDERTAFVPCSSVASRMPPTGLPFRMVMWIAVGADAAPAVEAADVVVFAELPPPGLSTTNRTIAAAAAPTTSRILSCPFIWVPRSLELADAGQRVAGGPRPGWATASAAGLSAETSAGGLGARAARVWRGRGRSATPRRSATAVSARATP